MKGLFVLVAAALAVLALSATPALSHGSNDDGCDDPVASSMGGGGNDCDDDCPELARGGGNDDDCGGTTRRYDHRRGHDHRGRHDRR